MDRYVRFLVTIFYYTTPIIVSGFVAGISWFGQLFGGNSFDTLSVFWGSLVGQMLMQIARELWKEYGSPAKIDN
jgi:hypothetical protein